MDIEGRVSTADAVGVVFSAAAKESDSSLNNEIKDENEQQETVEEEVVESEVNNEQEESVVAEENQEDNGNQEQQEEVIQESEEGEDSQDEEESQSAESASSDWTGDAISKGWMSPETQEEKLKEIHEKYQTELETKIKEVQGNPTPDPVVNKLVELANNGKVIDMNFIKNQFINYDDYKITEKDSALELIKMNMQQSGESELKIKRKEREYKLLFNGEYDETDPEYMDLMEDLQLESTEARNSLKDKQAAEKLPDVEKLTQEQIAKQEAEARESQKVWESAVKNEVKTKESIKINLNKEDSFEYALSSDDRKEIQDMLSTDFGFTKRFYENGVFDFESAIEAASFVIPDIKGRILKKMASQYEAKGKDSLISKQKNTKLEKPAPFKVEKAAPEAAAAESIFNRHNKR